MVDTVQRSIILVLVLLCSAYCVVLAHVSDILVKVRVNNDPQIKLAESVNENTSNLRPEIIRISSTPLAPFSQIDLNTDKVFGLEIQLVRMVAKGLGLQAEIEMYNKSTILQQLIEKYERAAVFIHQI